MVSSQARSVLAAHLAARLAAAKPHEGRREIHDPSYEGPAIGGPCCLAPKARSFQNFENASAGL